MATALMNMVPSSVTNMLNEYDVTGQILEKLQKRLVQSPVSIRKRSPNRMSTPSAPPKEEDYEDNDEYTSDEDFAPEESCTPFSEALIVSIASYLGNNKETTTTAKFMLDSMGPILGDYIGEELGKFLYSSEKYLKGTSTTWFTLLNMVMSHMGFCRLQIQKYYAELPEDLLSDIKIKLGGLNMDENIIQENFV